MDMTFYGIFRFFANDVLIIFYDFVYDFFMMFYVFCFYDFYVFLCFFDFLMCF